MASLNAAEFEALMRALAVEEVQHRVRKAKAEADLAEFALQHGRRVAFPELNVAGKRSGDA